MSLPPVPAAAAASPFLTRQFWLITAGAIAIFAGLRLLPTGTNLSHMDFRVDPRAGNAIEFCDPLNPQFIPVTAARSPVTLAIRSEAAPVAGREVRAVVTLKTGSGKPVEPADLLVTHTRRLHLLLVDPTLTDYQHVHPDPSGRPGEWRFAFTPRAAGTYRIFGDFTPAATGRGLYSSVDLEIAAGATAVAAGDAALGERVERDGFTYTLTSQPRPARANQPIDLQFAIARADGAAVPLEPVMGAFAHLVAFDEVRSGFAHLHPAEADLTRPPDARRPVLNFKLTIPRAGRYIVWAQINLGGTETFVPFALRVE
ncbi:MAG: hypothetical protein JNL92_17430 [Opitutaceae bacterium]|nr:hypothetical protein [Opitutaceae bacterium]